ncbi:glycoside hydrolase family 19 protein [Falsiroseomonas stagni]|uniref:Chitinase class I n=1 Tax=Falsiroseomonas stagni DSM 19981 TaxID=1123062 RepID=A0A1I4AC99_9PROT|nr:glycoside hydrolase family 19 protein [Falsiroseomonas stagni]SFK53426.1 Chitinase class I [Falsiroseomonas stagni DSM 19981]
MGLPGGLFGFEGDGWRANPLGDVCPAVMPRPGLGCHLPISCFPPGDVAGPVQQLADVPITEEDLLRLVGQGKTLPGTQRRVFDALVAASKSGALWFHEISRSGLRLSHFLAQCCIESSSFQKLDEGFVFSTLAGLLATHGRYLTEEQAKSFLPEDQKTRHDAIKLKAGEPKTPEEKKALEQALADSDVAEKRKPQELANTVYANRNGNGGVESGDGWTYRGRGLIQLTGRGNYREAGKALDLPLEAQPQLVSKDAEIALKTAAWFWTRHKLNDHADMDDALKVSQAINLGPNAAGGKGKPNHLKERQERTETAKAIWGDWALR